MPGAIRKGDELHEPAIASNQEMRRYLQMGNGAKAVVRMRVETIAEQTLDVRSTELTGRQADSVNDDQVDTTVGGSGIEVR